MESRSLECTKQQFNYFHSSKYYIHLFVSPSASVVSFSLKHDIQPSNYPHPVSSWADCMLPPLLSCGLIRERPDSFFPTCLIQGHGDLAVAGSVPGLVYSGGVKAAVVCTSTSVFQFWYDLRHYLLFVIHDELWGYHPNRTNWVRWTILGKRACGHWLLEATHSDRACKETGPWVTRQMSTDKNIPHAHAVSYHPWNKHNLGECCSIRQGHAGSSFLLNHNLVFSLPSIFRSSIFPKVKKNQYIKYTYVQIWVLTVTHYFDVKRNHALKSYLPNHAADLDFLILRFRDAHWGLRWLRQRVAVVNPLHGNPIIFMFGVLCLWCFTFFSTVSSGWSWFPSSWETVNVQRFR